MTTAAIDEQKEIVRYALNASIDLANETLDRPSTSAILTIFSKMIPNAVEKIEITK